MSRSTTKQGRPGSTRGAGETESRNRVEIAGRVSGAPVARELPSGDSLVQLRVVVPRSAPRGRSRQKTSATADDGAATSRRPRQPPSVDTIDVAVWGRALQRRALKLGDGTQVLVCGALRRRFWRGPGGPVSRYEVEASSLEVLQHR